MTIDEMKAFCKESIPDRDWENGELDTYNDMDWWLHEWPKVDGAGVEDCQVFFSPDEHEFQYVASNTIRYDSTWLVLDEAIENLIDRLVHGMTWFRPMGENCKEDKVRYYIGNMFILHEHGDFLQSGEECNDIMLYPSMRSTVMIPVRMERENCKSLFRNALSVRDADLIYEARAKRVRAECDAARPQQDAKIEHNKPIIYIQGKRFL